MITVWIAIELVLTALIEIWSGVKALVVMWSGAEISLELKG